MQSLLVRVLAALLLLSAPPAAVALKLQAASNTAPDVSDQVAEEAQQNIQIHEGFWNQEQQDDHEDSILAPAKHLNAVAIGKKWAVALDRDMKTKMLVQVASN